MVDNVERHVETSGKYTGTARAELVKAQEYQSKARKVHIIREKKKQTEIWMISLSILCTSSRQSTRHLRTLRVEVFHLLIFINSFSLPCWFRFYDFKLSVVRVIGLRNRLWVNEWMATVFNRKFLKVRMC